MLPFSFFLMTNLVLTTNFSDEHEYAQVSPDVFEKYTICHFTNYLW